MGQRPQETAIVGNKKNHFSADNQRMSCSSQNADLNQPTPRRHCAQRGLTLIEVVIVLAIMSIIAMIGAPFYNGYVNEARIATAVQDIRQMGLILDDFYLDNDPPATLAAAGIDIVDPWGNPYEYLWLRGNPAPELSGKRRRDKSMNPVNSDYDLYSKGADGQTATQFTAKKARDDVVRANDGDFVGLAEDH